MLYKVTSMNSASTDRNQKRTSKSTWDIQTRARCLSESTVFRCGTCNLKTSCFIQRKPPKDETSDHRTLRYMSAINQPSLPTPISSVLVPIFVFMALSTIFLSINSLDNSPFSNSVLPALCLSYWSFQLYVTLHEKTGFLTFCC